MTETAKAVINRLQGEAGHATGGEVDRLVFSGLDVHTMLNEIEQAIDTDKLSVKKLQEQLNTAKKALTEISEVKNLTPFKKGFETSKAVSKARDMRNTARQALAAIGGDDE